jgi:hypothetical protein
MATTLRDDLLFPQTAPGGGGNQPPSVPGTSTAMSDPNADRRIGRQNTQRPSLLAEGRQAFSQQPRVVNMGPVDEVDRPRLSGPAAPRVAPTAGAVNPPLSGIGQDGVSPADRVNGTTQPRTTLAGGARTLLNGGMGRLMVGSAAVQAGVQSAEDDSTARYARRFGVSEPTGDGSAADIAKFVGLRAGGFASDLGNNLTGGLVGRALYRDMQQPAAVQPQPAAGPIGTAEAPDSIAGAALPAANGVRRVDFTNGAPPLFTNQPQAQDDAFSRKSGGFVGTVPAMDIAAVNKGIEGDRELSLMRAGLRDHGDVNAYRQPSEGERLQANVANASLGGRAGAKAALRQFNQNQLEQTRQVGENARAQATLRLGVMNAQRDQDNKDREFNAGQAKSVRDFGAAQEQQQVTNKGAAEKRLNDRYTAQFTTTDAAGKPTVDIAKVARYTQGVQQYIGARAAQLRQEGNTAAADELSKRGAHALTDEQLSRLEGNMRLQDRIKEASGSMPGTATYVDSNNPEDFAIERTEQSLIGSPTYVTKNKSRIRANDLKYTEPANAVLPDIFKQRTSVFDPATRGLRNGN